MSCRIFNAREEGGVAGAEDMVGSGFGDPLCGFWVDDIARMSRMSKWLRADVFVERLRVARRLGDILQSQTAFAASARVADLRFHNWVAVLLLSFSELSGNCQCELVMAFEKSFYNSVSGYDGIVEIGNSP